MLIVSQGRRESGQIPIRVLCCILSRVWPARLAHASYIYIIYLYLDIYIYLSIVHAIVRSVVLSFALCTY